MNKRIAFFTSQYAEVVSGPGRFAQYLRENPPPGLDFVFVSEQIKNKTHKEIPVPFPRWINRLPLFWLLKSWFYTRALEKYFLNHPVDCILSSDFSLVIFANKTLCTRLFTMVNDDNYLLIYQKGEHQKGMATTRRWARRLGYFLEKYVVKKSAQAVSNSLYTKGLLEKIYGVPSNRSLLLYKAVDLSFFTPRSWQVQKPRQFLFVKNDWKRGGLDIIIKALAQLSYQEEVNFTMVGIFEKDHPNILELIAESGFRGKYQLHGLFQKEALVGQLAKTDLFISMSRQEALGVSCLEAMASGVPVVASDAGGLPEVLNFGQAGFIVPKNNENALLQLLEQINLHPEQMVEKRENALQHIHQFSVQKLQENLRVIFNA